MNNNQMNFDPMTGQPINQNNTIPNQEQNINQQNIPIVQTNVTPVQQIPNVQSVPSVEPIQQVTPIQTQQQMQNIATVEQSKQDFINNTQANTVVKKDEKQDGPNIAFIVILFAIIFAAIFFLFPYLLKVL